MPELIQSVHDLFFSDQDLYLFSEGTHNRLYEKLGAHPMKRGGVDGTHFSVWAPNAASVHVIGDFNGWRAGDIALEPVRNSGIWAAFVPDVGAGARYKFAVNSRHDGFNAEKTDPFGFHFEVSPATASVVTTLEYEWRDDEWMSQRAGRNALTAPMSIYEMHLGSWMRPDGSDEFLSYREIAPRLVEHLTRVGFTHVEFLPVMEHPFYGSWGYQTTGYFAPSSRYGSPQDFMYLVDELHRNGIGVILDWVPSHFPGDGHALAYFDGTHLYEHADPRQGFHPDWNSYIFNYGRNEVRSFLLSSARFWLDHYHADGLRVDAVASMLYLDYSRKAGEWIPNEYGGRENLEAIQFLRRLNADVYGAHPETQTMAEESTAWPMVSRPVYVGGLGFGMKWDMGWMHDTLDYMSKDPIHRHYHHGELTFRMIYAFNENFVLPLSHDEVVHGKGSLIGKMPGDDWQRFANLRALYGYMFMQPGKKLLFMGAEIGQWREWNHEGGLDWHLLQQPLHAGLQRCLGDLNRIYRDESAAHELDFHPDGFEWVDANDNAASVISFLRRGRAPDETLLVVCNFTPVVRTNYRIGVDEGGYWAEIFNSDAEAYGGSGVGNLGGTLATPMPCHGRLRSVTLTLPPLGVLILKRKAESAA